MTAQVVIKSEDVAVLAAQCNVAATHVTLFAASYSHRALAVIKEALSNIKAATNSAIAVEVRFPLTTYSAFLALLGTDRTLTLAQISALEVLTNKAF